MGETGLVVTQCRLRLVSLLKKSNLCWLGMCWSMAAGLSWLKLVMCLSWAGAIASCLGPAHDQLRISLNQLKPAAMLQHIPNQHMMVFSTGISLKGLSQKSNTQMFAFVSVICMLVRKSLKRYSVLQLKSQYHIFVIATLILSTVFSRQRCQLSRAYVNLHNLFKYFWSKR